MFCVLAFISMSSFVFSEILLCFEPRGHRSKQYELDSKQKNGTRLTCMQKNPRTMLIVHNGFHYDYMFQENDQSQNKNNLSKAFSISYTQCAALTVER